MTGRPAGRLVSLPMYAAPAEAMTAFWQGLQAHMRRAGIADVPDELTAPDDLDGHWMSPNLLLSQTCGYPLTTVLAGRVQYVGTPHYRAAGCRGPFYSSVVVVRTDDAARSLADLRGRKAAVNGAGSQSGYHVLRAMIAPLAEGRPFFATVHQTGAHRASAKAVREGEADVAAIDAVTYALLLRDQPDEVAGLRVLAATDPVPGLPLITAPATTEDEIDALRESWKAVLADPALGQARDALLLDGFSVLDVEDYAVIPAMSEQARRAGYPVLQ